jgi:predicted secreted protein
MNDARSKRLVLVCHCILNQNSKIEGIARFPGTFRPVVDLLLEVGAGIYQLPCPEMTYLGISRWSAVKDQYDSPFFRRHCRNLAANVMDEIEDYHRRGYQTGAVLGMNGSPACGVDLTPQPLDEPWGGRITGVPSRRLLPESGTFMEILRQAADERSICIPFIGLPEVEEAGSLDEALAQVRSALAIGASD